MIEACILATLFFLATIFIAVVAGYCGDKESVEQNRTRARGLMGFFLGILVPLAGTCAFSSILCPNSDFSGLIICRQRPESAFVLFTMYLGFVVFGSYIGGLLSANIKLGFLTGLVSGIASIPLAILGLAGQRDFLKLLYGNDVALYILLGIIGGLVGGITAKERRCELIGGSLKRSYSSSNHQELYWARATKSE